MSVIPIAVRFRSIAAHALHLLIALTFGWCAIAPARAADVTERQIVIDIRAQPLASALIEFSKQTQVQVMSQGVDLAQRQTSGIAGKYTIAAALKQLLAGSHLEYSATGPNTIAVTAAATHTTALQPGDDQSGDRSYLRIAQAGPFAAAPQTSGSPDTQASDVQRSAQSETQEVKVVTQRPFTDENVDIVRKIDDPQPYYIFDSRAIAQSGAVDAEDFLKQRLTMNTEAQTNAQALTFRGNVSAINLRGVGASQTLILVNGRRLAAVGFNGSNYQPDINSIPTALIDRIEVLPASASAIYGGAAVGGVVNIVLKHDYQGGDVRVTYDNTFNSNTPIRTVDGSYGISLEGGRTNIEIAAHYTDADLLQEQDRTYLSDRGRNAILRNNPALLYSVGSPYAGASTNIASANGSNLVLKPAYGGTALNSPFTYVPVGTASDTAAAALGTTLAGNAGRYNLGSPATVGGPGGQFNPLLAPSLTKSLLVGLRRQMTDYLEVFAEFSEGRNSTRFPIDTAIGTVKTTIPAGAATNPFQQSVVVTFPDVVRGDLWSENISRRLTTGLTVNLPWQWRAEGDYTWTDNRYTYLGPINLATYSPALSPAAALAAGSLNPFVDTLAHPLNLAPYVGTYGTSDAPASLNDVGVRFSGPLVQFLPADAPELTIGLEHRKEGNGDAVFTATWADYQSSDVYRTFLGKTQTTNSAYAELELPLIAAANAIPGVHELSLQAAGRTERYSVKTGTSSVTAGVPITIVSNTVDYTSTNPTVGLKWKPIPSVILRASYGTAFLPPAYSQLAAPLLGGGNPASRVSVIDPLRGHTATLTQYLAGGNPDLEPQTSTEWNAGVIFEPTWLEGLRLDFEWWRLDLDNQAVTLTQQQIVDNETLYPGRVTRAAPTPGDPYAAGPITLVDGSLITATKANTTGYDMSLDYRWKTQHSGTFELSGAATVIDHFRQQLGFNMPLVDLTGQVARGGPLKTRGNMTLTWARRGWTAGWTATYYGSYLQYQTATNNSYVLAQGSSSIPSQLYHDIFAGYAFDAGASATAHSLSARVLSGVVVQARIKNVFGQLPPFDAYYGYGYYSPFGDPRLRSFQLSLAKHF